METDAQIWSAFLETGEPMGYLLYRQWKTILSREALPGSG